MRVPKHIAGADQANRALSIKAMLDQDVVWVDREGKSHQVSELEPRYASNIVQFLLRRASGLGFYYGLGQATEVDMWTLRFGEPDDFDIPLPEDEWDQQIEMPEAWLMSKPLLKALVRRAALHEELI